MNTKHYIPYFFAKHTACAIDLEHNPDTSTTLVAPRVTCKECIKMITPPSMRTH